MTDGFSLDSKTSALLVMDFQTAIINGYATDREALLDRTARLLDAARVAAAMIVYVAVGFRPGHPEISSRNGSFSKVKESGLFTTEDPAAEIHRAVAPGPGDVIVTKRRVGAFAGTDLDMILRANSVDTLVLAGISTSGVVLSTVRSGADADYRLVVAADCCSDPDVEVHRILCDKVFPRQAVVVAARDAICAFRGDP